MSFVFLPITIARQDRILVSFRKFTELHLYHLPNV